MKTYFAFEFASGGSFFMWADLQEGAMLAELDRHRSLGGVESLIIGRVQSSSVEDALAKVRAGEWIQD